MTQHLSIRLTEPADLESLVTLYPSAFPEEDLVPLVEALLAERDVLTLGAWEDDDLVAHAAFSPCSVDGTNRPIGLLGPVAVHPDHQGAGIGSAIIKDGLNRLRTAGYQQVQVLGDPNYYKRFGFRADDALAPPYPIPEDWKPAWQSLSLTAGLAPVSGTLRVSGAWQKPAYWAP